MAISFFLPLVSAIEFELTYPQNINSKESFSVSISSSDTETHDVKIFVQDSSKKTISQIYNEDWKSPHFYLKSVYPEERDFKIRITSLPGNYNLCARLRKTGKSSFDEKCYEINAGESVKPDSDLEEEKEEEESKEKEEEEEGEKISPQVNRNIIPTLQKIQIENNSVIIKEKQKIMLNSETEQKEEIFISKYEKQKIFILYGVIFLFVIVIILLALNKL